MTDTVFLLFLADAGGRLLILGKGTLALDTLSHLRRSLRSFERVFYFKQGTVCGSEALVSSFDAEASVRGRANGRGAKIGPDAATGT